VIESTGASLVYRTPVIDFVGAQRIATAYAQKNCPDVNAAARIMDLFAKLALLRDPTPTLRKVQP
jgi:predicted ATP-grasp superfamily ATP-dependent carboligase